MRRRSTSCLHLPASAVYWLINDGTLPALRFPVRVRPGTTDAVSSARRVQSTAVPYGIVFVKPPRPILTALITVLAVTEVACGGSGSQAKPPTTSAPVVLSMTVSTSNGLVGKNNDDVTCAFGIDRGFGTPAAPLTYTVKDEAGTIVATGTLGGGKVVSKRPAYRCTTEEKVMLQGPARFVQVEFVNGQRATGPADAPLAVELS